MLTISTYPENFPLDAVKVQVIADFLSIMAGSLDDPSEFRPAMDLYVASAQPWDYMNPDLPKFSKSPPLNVAAD